MYLFMCAVQSAAWMCNETTKFGLGEKEMTFLSICFVNIIIKLYGIFLVNDFSFCVLAQCHRANVHLHVNEWQHYFLGNATSVSEAYRSQHGSYMCCRCADNICSGACERRLDSRHLTLHSPIQRPQKIAVECAFTLFCILKHHTWIQQRQSRATEWETIVKNMHKHCGNDN